MNADHRLSVPQQGKSRIPELKKGDVFLMIKKNRMIGTAVCALITAMTLTACVQVNVNTAEAAAADRESVNQVSLLQGLTFGDYNGSRSAEEVKSMGDIGIGTFDALNGELIMLDGVIYRAAGDGSVEAVDDSETIPFCDVTWFDSDESETITDIQDIASLKEVLDKKVNELGTNRFYFIRIDGKFKEMNVRSELAQTEPYKPLAKVLETDQTFFDYSDIDGTVVGLYCPDYMDRLNAVGWHFHFISDDREKGGHMLDLKFDSGELKWDYTDGFSMILPENEMFSDFDLTVDQSEDIRRVETGDGE